MSSNELEEVRHVVVRPLTGYRARPTEWLMPARIPQAELTILAGDGGLGKSTLAAWIAAQVTNGAFRGQVGSRRVMVLLGEDDPARVLKLRYRAAGCRMESVAIVTSAVRGAGDSRGDEILSLPGDFAQLAALVAQHTPDLLIVDPLTAFLSGSVDAHRDGGQGGLRSVLGPLSRLAHEHGTTVLCCAHLNKGAGPAGQRIAGSAGVRNAARNVLLLVAHPEARDDGEDDGRRLLGHEKCNGGPTTGTLDATVVSAPAVGDDGKPLRQSDGAPATTSLVEIGGDSDVDYRDALTAASTAATADAPAGGRAEAERFLLEALSAGPMEVRTLNAEAAVLGIASRTLDRARKALGTLASKGANGWSVALPDGGGGLGVVTKPLASTGGPLDTFDDMAKNAKASDAEDLAALAAFPRPEAPS